MAFRYWDLRPLDYVTNKLSALWWLYVLQGIGLILLGLAVVLFPELLTILASSLFVAVGIVLLTLAWRIRRVKHSCETFKRHVLEL